MGSQKIFIFDFFKKFNKSNIFNIIIAQKKSVNKKTAPEVRGLYWFYADLLSHIIFFTSSSFISFNENLSSL